MSGVIPRILIGEELARPAHAALHFVEDQQQPIGVAERAQGFEEFGRGHADAAFALHRLNHDGGGLRRDRRLDGCEIAERHLIEAFERRAEALKIFRIATRRDGRHRPPVEGALERDDPVALRMAANELIAACGLDRAFHRLGAGIGEEDEIGEACRDQPRAELFGLGNFEKVGHVPQFLALLLQRLDEMRMRMAERRRRRCQRRNRDICRHSSHRARRPHPARKQG